VNNSVIPKVFLIQEEPKKRFLEFILDCDCTTRVYTCL